ncbi:ABC transporter ATP-binding protein/permease [Alphaproteobacteria bacterium]|nr:ABC transporter ATP-binding protein/permease [Alphaproteobacteria bacterium]
MPTPTHPELLRRIWKHINRQRRIQFGILFLAMILASFAEVVSIGAVLPFLSALTAPDIIFGHPIAEPFIRALNLTEPKQLLLPLTITFAICVLLSGTTRLILLWLQTRLSHAIGADLSVSIYRRTLYQPYSVHVARNSSEVIASISTKANTVVSSTIMPLVTIISSILMLLSILLALLAIEPDVAIIGLVGFGAIYMVVILVTKKVVQRDSQRINYETGRLIKAIQEGLGGIRDVLIDGTQATYCSIYRDADLPMRRARANIAIIGSSPRFAIEAIGMVLIASLAYSLAGRSSSITSAMPVLGAMVLGAQRMLPVLQAFYASWTLMRGGQAYLNDTLNLLDQSLPDYADGPPQTLMSFQNSITLNNLAFQYSKDAPWVLRKGFNFSIKKGSRIGFMGATGSGKSTLLDVIMGLLQPTLGSLEIDGINISEQNRRGWQAHIAHVPQEIFLADTSIAENIAFGVPVEKIDYARVNQAANRAQIAKTIETWSNKYNTLIGERGVRLSGGQRQRIGIARALYKKADVIVFDEATSSLDNDTERTVMETIDSLGDELTVIIVAHRLTTLKNCTHVVEMENGKVKRCGTYEEIVGIVA